MLALDHCDWWLFLLSKEVKTLPETAESIFCVIDVSASTGLCGMAGFGAAGILRSPLPGGSCILSCGWPCVCSVAISSAPFPIAPASAETFSVARKPVQQCDQMFDSSIVGRRQRVYADALIR